MEARLKYYSSESHKLFFKARPAYKGTLMAAGQLGRPREQTTAQAAISEQTRPYTGKIQQIPALFLFLF